MIDTSGTRYRFDSPDANLWVLANWRDYFEAVGLHNFEDFFSRTGNLVDRNRRSEVHRIRLGADDRTFYLKRHTDYMIRSWRRCLLPVPVIRHELENMMRYARIGFDALEPAAWGWRPHRGGGRGFLLVEALPDFRSLEQMLPTTGPRNPTDRQRLRRLESAVASMLARIHQAGICHRDLFSWHVFVRSAADSFDCQPIDLERSVVTLPLGNRWRRRCRAGDLAALHLTVPFERVNSAARLRFFLKYLGSDRLDDRARSFLEQVLKQARRKGRKRKFNPYGVSERLRLRRPGA